jgi:hypothetical protein
MFGRNAENEQDQRRDRGDDRESAAADPADADAFWDDALDHVD